MKKCLISLTINEMQIKTTLRFYLTSVRMAIINNTNNNNAGEDTGKGTLLHCWWECKLVHPLWSVPQKTENSYHRIQ
jgi:hypothetical protein